MAKNAVTAGNVMGTLAELIAKVAQALNVSPEQAERIVWVTLHPEPK